MAGIFDSKYFNAEVFQEYLDSIPNNVKFEGQTFTVLARQDGINSNSEHEISADENETRDEIGKLFREDGYLVDPHTAVGFRCAEKYFADTGDGTVTVVASTASPYKFPADVCAALGDPVGSDDPAEALNALSAATGEKGASLSGMLRCAQIENFLGQVEMMKDLRVER